MPCKKAIISAYCIVIQSGYPNAHRDLVKTILQAAGEKTVTLVYAARDTEHNNAAALKEFLETKS